MKTKAPGLEVVTRDRATRKTETARSDSTAPPNPTATLQARGQLARALDLDEQADRLAAAGRWPDARRLRHEANQLRRLARGPRPQAPRVDIERELAAARLGRWADRSAA